MWNSIRLHNSNSHSQVLHTHTHMCMLLKICPDAWDWGEDEVINAHARVWIRMHTHPPPTPHTGSIPTTNWLWRQQCYGFIVGRRTAGNAGRAGWNTWQGHKCWEGMLPWQEGMMGNSRYVCYGGHPSGFRSDNPAWKYRVHPQPQPWARQSRPPSEIISILCFI